ncbi:MAG: hypothetical protein BMS9Abin33_0696 [Gammaproteobacteria bacterium]|nr:MAG: hypothetical protein BMS9Abin33_0696 [Gammaproteobacteria bacterium]
MKQVLKDSISIISGVNPIRYIEYGLLLLLFLVVGGITQAEEKKESLSQELVADIYKIESDLDVGILDIEGIGRVNKKLTAMKAITGKCISEYEKKVEEKEAALFDLGEKQKVESVEVTKQRKQLKSELQNFESELTICKTIAQRTQAALELADNQLQKRLEQQLLLRGPHIFKIINRNLSKPVDWFTVPWDYSREHGWIMNAPGEDLTIFAIVLLIGVIIGIVIRQRLLHWVKRHHWSDELGGRFSEAALATFCHYAPHLLGSLFSAVCLYYLTRKLPAIPIMAALAYSLSFLFLARYTIRLTLMPAAPGRLFLHIQPDIAKALARRLNVLAIIGMLGFLLVETLIGASLPYYATRLAHSVLRILFAINLIWALWLFSDFRGVLRKRWFRFGLSAVLVLSVIADLIGYYNLAFWLLRSVFGTLLALGTILLIGRLLSGILEGLEYGKTPWERRLRQLLGMTTEGHIPGFFWVRLLVILSLWAFLALLLIVIWDLSASVVEQIRVLFTAGFTIGSLKVVPARIAFALVTLAVLVAISAWIQGRMKKYWLLKMPMDRGAREALLTLTGYIGVAAAILVTLGVAGVDFASLAIIAGALSVGIGFGLQNIVNNFVSGLILLFERPIKTGDWIVVGNTEGHVKRIRMRSTQIETFDHADVIVPNSDLISGQVTNWMLRDESGRMRIHVSVAYGSDTAKVRDILFKIAHDHPEIIKDSSVPEPRVLFMQFGESSLDFELRCYIRNIDRRLRVTSDINFAIDAAFREAGIEIPFPQRDLHIKNWPGIPGEKE